ncbi:MAG TPA: PAS domain S-box protein [Candidatus Angelobacter sp.]|nr:PAS domain S-box protein [Candidatus Angelobacter sp.]
MNILIVDDDAGNRKLLRVTIEAEGHHTVEAEDGVQALAVLEREPVDGIISDILMPNMDGYRLCTEVRKSPRFNLLPFIIYTSTFTSPGDERLAREVGADEYLKKPSSTQTILAAFSRVVAEGKPGRPVVTQQKEELLLVREYSDLLVKKLEEKHRDLQRQTEELRRSEGRNRMLAAIVESSDDAIIGKALDGTITSWNPGARWIYGYTAEEAVGRHISMIFPPGRADEWRALLERAARGERVEGIETERIRKDGTPVEVSIKLSAIRDEAGQVVGISAIGRDLAERKKLEREVAVREHRLNSFFAGATAGLAVLDRELRFVQINDTLAGMNGLPAKDHLGRTVREVVPKLAPVVEPVFRKVLATGEPVLNVELTGETALRPGAQRHWVESLFPVVGRDGGVEGVGAVVVEITDRKRAEEALRSSEAKLRALAAHLQVVREEERTRISREIHDELGQMLTGLKMDLRWMHRKLAGRMSAETSAAIKQKLDEAGKLADDTIETVQRIAADLRPGILDSLGLTAALGYEENRFAERSGIRCKTTLAEGLPALGRDVNTNLFRIYQEMLTNVARHADARTVEVRLTEQRKGWLLLEVQDDGKGISDDAAAKPTSLGLVGMSERAESLGGRICIEGATGSGTTVKLWVPVEKRS